MSLIEELLTVADAYQEATRFPDSRVSWRVFGDTKKLAALRADKDIQVKRAESAMRWFSDNWPENASWPELVHRPAPQRAHDGNAA